MDINEQELFVELSEEGEVEFVTFRIELLVLLMQRPQLLALAVSLYVLFQLGYAYKKQRELAERVGLSWDTYRQYRDALVEVGVLYISQDGKKQKIQFRRLNNIGAVKLPKLNQGEYLDKKQEEVRPLTPQDVANQQQIKIDAEIVARANEKAKEIVKKKEIKAKKEEQRFPEEDYQLVLNAYRKYRGVGISGPEVAIQKKWIKQMFLSGRSIKQIVDCMKFFAEHRNDENFKWLSQWNCHTVFLKLPDFVAGNMKVRTMDDDYPDA